MAVINKAILIGETGLCTQCAERLLLSKWKIPSIVSDDQVVIAWAKNNHIKVISPIQLGNIKESNFYLFSIINPYIIPKSVLASKNVVLALNYHDSPLPKYAGVNSTTWAILNDEKTHGVTLHKITAGIDEGDIVGQSIINIEKDETAISLNLKCSEYLLLLFQDVIIKIEKGKLKAIKQDLANRSYYGLKSFPANYGIVNGIKGIEVLYRLVRALTFGDSYNNPVASVKMWLKKKFYIVENFNPALIKANRISNKNTVVFDKVKDIYGNQTNLKVRHKDILTGYQLTADALKYLSGLKLQEKKHKQRIVEFFKTYSDATTTVLTHSTWSTDNYSISKKRYAKKISLLKHSDITIFIVAYIVLARFFYDSKFIISLYVSDSSIPVRLQHLVEARGFIYANNDILKHGFNHLKNYLLQTKKDCCSITKDFGYRYGLQLLTDIAITLGKIAITDQHKIVIAIEKDNFTIAGDADYRIQIDNITESIKTILTENTLRKITTKDLACINLLSKVRYKQIAYDWNKTEKSYSRNQTIHALFEQQAAKTPNNIAIVSGNTKLTYSELNSKANQLANYLCCNYNIKPDDLVVICIDRNEQMLVAMLGVLKSGGAYVPIDPSYPDERIGYILKDTKAKVVLTNEIHKNKLQHIVKQKTKKAKVIAIDDEIIQVKLVDQKNTNPTTTTTSTNLVYVIYTSGTTGNPKGVLVEHYSVANCITYLINRDKLNSKTIGSQYASFSFDASVIEIYPILLVGGSLYFISEQDKFDPIKINDFYDANKITYAFLPTKLAEEFFKLKNTGLVNLIVAGEKLENFIKQPYKINNGYGPTENTVYTTNFIVNKHYKNIPIGKPISNVKCYVIDNYLNLLPMGAIGELVIGGEDLARGYLNQTVLTREKFIANPFQTRKEKAQRKNARLYKTGDLVRLLPDGNLEFIGRNDFQVKIRGYRVELGEIEKKLVSYPGIRQAVVLAKERGELHDKYLLAYYVADKKLEETKIQTHLASQLPEYMLPHILIYLDNLPLTVNGKLDRKAFPEPELTKSSEYVAPRNELEQKLCEVYAQVLNLPIHQIGIKDDFFMLGGDSISSIQAVLKIRQQLRLDINVKNIFEQKTIEQLASILEDQAHQQENTDNIQDLEIKNVYLANNLQQGFISHAIKQGKIDSAYLSQFIWQYKIPINESKFKTAWQLVYRKHPGLRLKFAWDDELIQIIDQDQKLNFRYIELVNLSTKTDFECQVEEIIKEDRQEYYDLQKGNLLRVYLIKLSANDYFCICSLHHIIFDGWSFPLLLNSVHEIYTQLLENKRLNIVEDTVYQKAQDYLQKHKNEDQEYWRNRIEQIEERVNLKSLLKPSAQNVEIENYTLIKEEQEQCIEITGQKLDKLKKTCQANAITINSVIQYAWHKLLHIYGNSNTTVVGTVVSGRNLPIDNIENSVGLFINTLPLIFNHNNKPNLIKQIKVIQDLINEANSRSNVSLADLQFGGQRLFDSLIAYENYPTSKSNMGIKCENIKEVFKVDYPIVIVVYEKKGNTTIRLKYAGELFNQENISQLLNRLMFFIEQISDDSYKKNLTYLNLEEYQHIVIDYNKTERSYPTNKTVHQLFEKQVFKTPGNIAVICADNQLTYEELNNKANQLANYLRQSYDIKPGNLIALCLDRSEWMIIAMLGVLKSGGAYVPIDPGYPDERISYVLEDTKVKVILTNEIYRNRFRQVINQRAKRTEVIAIDNEKTQIESAKQKNTNPVTSTANTDLIYVIYTSGTTGNPKGVMIEHSNVVSLVKDVTYISIDTSDVFIHFSDSGFDAATFEIWMPLLNGAKLIIPCNNKTDLFSNISLFNAVLTDNNVTVLWLTKVLFDHLFVLDETVFRNLKYLLVGGEALNRQLISKLINSNHKPKNVINGYGPTENTTFSCTLNITKESIKSANTIPIGVPLTNRTAYVLEADLNPLPIGTIGELYIGGAGIGRGYLNRSDLTAEKFILNPFQTKNEKSQNKNNKLYKTGDLVRMLADSNLEYVGRNDSQFKIRGYRIEPGEIENKLLNYPQINQVSVISKEKEDNKYLIACYVSNNKLEQSKLRNYLLSQLPEYMIPNIFIHMEKLPFTKNGKLDRKALLQLEFENKDNYITPKNEQERLICEVFAEVLGIQEIGIKDDFFLLGGNSIQAIKLVSMLQENFDIKVIDVFNLRTPEKLAKSSIFGKNFLQHKLRQVKLAYQEKINKEAVVNMELGAELQRKLKSYTKSIEGSHIDSSFKKQIINVLLTGATGYLGCNILNQLLKLTDYNVLVLVRANSQLEATEKIIKKYQFYFDELLNDVIDLRVFVIVADIEKDYLGLLDHEYQALIKKVDSVIHAAALVKHYGEYDKFYAANVKATVNLLEFAKLTKLKDFHYISTIGVLNYISVVRSIKFNCIENDLPLTSEIMDNVYAQTKLLGEHQVTRYRDLRLNCNIYRVGNLAFISKNYRAQENLEDNAFYNWLKCLFTIKCTAEEIINNVEISQVDLTARAIVKIFDKKHLDNQTYHVFNPNVLNMVKFFEKKGGKLLPIESFIDCIEQHIKSSNHYDLIARFLLHQGWTDWWDNQKITFNKVLQNKTQHILKQLNFEWLPITDSIMCSYLNSLKLIREDNVNKKQKIFSDLEKLAPLIPTPLSWLDMNGVVLGGNDLSFQVVGATTIKEQIIGRTPYDFYPKDIAGSMMEKIKQVIQEKRQVTFEESIVDIETGKTKWFLATRAPLLDDEGINIVGIVSTAIEITDRKEAEQLRIEAKLHKAQIQEQLKFKKIVDQAAHDIQSPLAILLILAQQCSGLVKEKVFEILKTSTAFMPVGIYWLDTNNKVIGANESIIAAVGGKSIDDFLGKTPYEYYPHEMADNIVKHNNEVMRTGKILSQEEQIKDVTTGKTKYFIAYKAPLFDNNEKIIGTLGTSVDITTEKETEYTKEELRKAQIESDLQKAKLEEHRQFKEVVDQVVHDIRTPLASIMMQLRSNAAEIPEKVRIGLNESATSSIDIANDLLDRYKKDKQNVDFAEEQRPAMISMMLSQVLSAKRYQYKDLSVKFIDEFCQGSAFVFIKVEQSHFMRMMSNLINNAVEAFEGKKGTVCLDLNLNEGNVVITIQDNGKGMPKEVVGKILSDEVVATDKKEGHGIGLTQIRETIKRNQGKLDVKSILGEGTKVVLTFPIVEQPDWIAKNIKLNKGDTVVILDDDSSIHGAWDSCFKDHADDIHIQHFTFGNDAVYFIDTFPEKDKIFLLTDQELLKQNITGIDVIKKTDIKRAILVTSHYAEEKVYKLVIENGIKLLPKQLASEIPIEICETNKERCRVDSDKKCDKTNNDGADKGRAEKNQVAKSKSKKTNVVVIEDDKGLADTEARLFKSKNKKADI